MKKKTEAKLGLYLVTPERKPGIMWPFILKDARPGESQYCYSARKYMEAQAAHTNARVQLVFRGSPKVSSGRSLQLLAHLSIFACLIVTRVWPKIEGT